MHQGASGWRCQIVTWLERVLGRPDRTACSGHRPCPRDQGMLLMNEAQRRAGARDGVLAWIIQYYGESRPDTWT
jgi:hypothetical protein